MVYIYLYDKAIESRGFISNRGNSCTTRDQIDDYWNVFTAVKCTQILLGKDSCIKVFNYSIAKIRWFKIRPSALHAIALVKIETNCTSRPNN